MIISELIAKLEELRAVCGDANVEVRNAAGEWDYAGEILVMHNQYPRSINEIAVLIDV